MCIFTNAQEVKAGGGKEWARHTIDASSQGADGVKLGDWNGDGRLDVVTGWEEGGEVKICLNPGEKSARNPWQSLLVGKVKNPEDAVFADLDGDGKFEVLSATEGGTKQVYWHREIEGKWRSDAFPALAGKQMWMQLLPFDVDGLHGMDFMVGGKEKGAGIGWMRAPAQASALADWEYVRLRDAGWIMSLIAHDLDRDGDVDLIFSDRKGAGSGLFWLENPSKDQARKGEAWREHAIGALGREVMFADVGSFDQDAWHDVAVAVKPHEIHLFRGRADGGWTPQVMRLLDQKIGRAKAVKMADLNGDGRTDFVFTCENAIEEREGVVWLENRGGDDWLQHSLSGPRGVKFDLIKTLDLDGDGDLDVMTCEEKEQLGVIWYENPSVP